MTMRDDKNPSRPMRISLRARLKRAEEDCDAQGIYAVQCETLAYKVKAVADRILQDNPIILAVPGMRGVRQEIVRIQHLVAKVADNHKKNVENAKALRGEEKLEVVDAQPEDTDAE
jgi:hypothetical protein